MTRPDRFKAPQSNWLRHSAGFVASGIIALVVDLAVTSLLVRCFGVSAFLARPPGIAVAIVVAWACHRRLTFAVMVPPSLSEFLKYATVASSAAGVNYAIYVGLLLAMPTLATEVALCGASVASLIVSYVGMRFGVFAQSTRSS